MDLKLGKFSSEVHQIKQKLKTWVKLGKIRYFRRQIRDSFSIKLDPKLGKIFEKVGP
jgi:hypothetical protein